MPALPSRPSRIVAWAERHQVALYLAAIALGVILGVFVPQSAPMLEPAITPALALLLFATFLGVPMLSLAASLRDLRFLSTVLVANFVVVPAIAFGLSRFVADDPGLLVGVLLVLLTPCVDYVIVFTGLAGGARARLLAATPLLLVLQMILLPAYLWLFAGAGVASAIEVTPFVEAFLLLIVAPLAAAAVVQGLARRSAAARTVVRHASAAMVPLLMATLIAVIGSQIARIGPHPLPLLRLVPLYVAYAVFAVAAGWLAARLARLDVPGIRAAMFSVATRNSLVVLPLALALPPALGLAPLAVVTQTLVELVAMVVLVRIVPLIAPDRTGARFENDYQ